MQKLGPQSDDDLSFLSSDQAVSYCNKLQICDDPSSKEKDLTTICDEFRDKLANQNKNILGLFTNMLNLNPYFRMSAFELLDDELFDRLRDPIKEQALHQMREAAKNKDLQYMIFLPFDEHDAFDYDNPVHTKFSIDHLKMALIEEI